MSEVNFRLPDSKQPLSRLLLLRRNYAFWKIFRNLYHLFCMANLMYSNECKPVIKIEFTEKRMRPVIDAQIAALCLIQER